MCCLLCVVVVLVVVVVVEGGGEEGGERRSQSFRQDYLKDGEPCLSRANAGGGSWRHRRSNRSLCLEKGEKTNRTIKVVSLRKAETEQLYRVKRMIRGIGHALFSTYSQTENV